VGSGTLPPHTHLPRRLDPAPVVLDSTAPTAPRIQAPPQPHLLHLHSKTHVLVTVGWLTTVYMCFQHTWWRLIFLFGLFNKNIIYKSVRCRQTNSLYISLLHQLGAGIKHKIMLWVPTLLRFQDFSKHFG